MKRREFLRMLAMAGALPLIGGELVSRTIFLPPAGGWPGPFMISGHEMLFGDSATYQRIVEMISRRLNENMDAMMLSIANKTFDATSNKSLWL